MKTSQSAFAKYQSNWSEAFAKRLTSSEWLNIHHPGMQILSPDGWDKTDWEYSFYKEKITELEFQARVIRSTITHNK